MNISFLLPLAGYSENLPKPTLYDRKSISRYEFYDVISKINKAYEENTSFSVDVLHSSFKNHISTIPEDQINGYICRNAKFFKSKIMGVLTIINPQIKVVIDSVSKVMILSNPEIISGMILSKNDILDNLNVCKSIEVLSTENLSIYRMSFDDSFPYKYIDLEIDRNFLIYKIGMFYNSDVIDNTVPDNVISSKPRVEIHCSNYVNKKYFPETYFDISDYIVFSNNKPILTTKYSKFKIIDLRK